MGDDLIFSDCYCPRKIPVLDGVGNEKEVIYRVFWVLVIPGVMKR